MVTLDKEVLEGAHVLHKVPSWLDEKRIGNNAKIVEMGTLANYKRFMKRHEKFNGSSQDSSMRENDYDFSGAVNYGAFMDLLDKGDMDVMERIKTETRKKVAELAKKYEEVVHNYKFDVTGHFFDVGLVVTGVPESWLEPLVEEEEHAQVEIVISGAFNAGTDKKAIIEGASRILAMTKILEDNGVQVKLKIVSCISGYASGKGDLYVATDVKAHDEPINYKKASALLSPTYLRRGMFKVMELVGKKNLSSGYGRPLTVKNFIELQHTSQINALEHKLFKGE